MKNKIDLPKIPWDRVLVISATTLGISLLFALVTRSRAIIMMVQFLDVAIILGLLGLSAFALVQRYKNK